MDRSFVNGRTCITFTKANSPFSLSGATGFSWADGYICGLTNHQGITPPVRVKVPVGPSGPISATRTASAAPCSTVSVPS